jgi:hypothetical protein
MQITPALLTLKMRKNHQQAGKMLMTDLDCKDMLPRNSQQLIVIRRKQQQRTTKKRRRKRRKKLIRKLEGEWNSGSVWLK